MSEKKAWKTFRFWFTIIASILSVSYFGFLFAFQFFGNVHPDIWTVITSHYAVFIGLPCAVLTSFLLVLILEQTHGEIKFEFGAVKFEGASGPIILWVFVYLSIITSIKLLW